MPFIEIVGPALDPPSQLAAGRGMTDGLVQAFGILPTIVTLYFQPVSPAHYVHAGSATGSETMRVFVKVHAFPRDIAMKRRAAAQMTEAYAAATGVDPASIAIYFLDRAPQDVAHGGTLACD